MNKIFSKTFWGFDWKKNLTTQEDIIEFSKSRLKSIKKGDIPENLYIRYCEVLNDQIVEERERLNSIESKALQIVGQLSLVLTIIGVFAPFAINKIPSDQVFLKIFSFGGILVVTLLFVYSIICALRNFDISKYKFVKTSEDTIIEHFNKDQKKLNFIIINDKILELRTNRNSVNAKASNVIYAFRMFKMGIISLVTYLIICSVILFYTPNNANTIEISPKSLEQAKELIKVPINIINIKIDSAMLK